MSFSTQLLPVHPSLSIYYIVSVRGRTGIFQNKAICLLKALRSVKLHTKSSRERGENSVLAPFISVDLRTQSPGKYSSGPTVNVSTQIPTLVHWQLDSWESLHQFALDTVSLFQMQGREDSLDSFFFLFLNIYLLIYFGFSGSQSWHAGSSLRRAGSLVAACGLLS